MGGVCVYEETTLVHELTQGIQMAKQLKVNLHSPEAREILIQKILSSYENALFVLKSGDSARLPRASSESSISIESPRSEVLEFYNTFSGHYDAQNVIAKKRKGFASLEDQDSLGNKVPRISYSKDACNHGAQSGSQPPPPSLSPEKQEITPTQHRPHRQLSPPNAGEMLSYLGANQSVNTSDLGSDAVSSLFSFPSTSFGLMEDYHQLQYSNHFDDGLLQIYSPPFISPANSGSNVRTEWGSSSLDVLAGQVDMDPNFEFTNSFF